MGILSPPFQPPFIRKTSSCETNAEGRFWRELKSTAETRMRGCPVIFNRLIIWMFWLKCKDEGKRRYDRPNEGMILLPPHENHAGIFENLKMCTYASGYTYVRIGLHVRTHRATGTYASGYTYVRMSLYVYMSLCQAVPNEYKVERFWCLPHKRMFKGFVFPRNIAVDKISLAAKRSRCF